MIVVVVACSAGAGGRPLLLFAFLEGFACCRLERFSQQSSFFYSPLSSYLFLASAPKGDDALWDRGLQKSLERAEKAK